MITSFTGGVTSWSCSFRKIRGESFVDNGIQQKHKTKIIVETQQEEMKAIYQRLGSGRGRSQTVKSGAPAPGHPN